MQNNQIVPGIAYYVEVIFDLHHPQIKRKKIEFEHGESDPIGTYDEAEIYAKSLAEKLSKDFRQSEIIQCEPDEDDNLFLMLILDRKETPMIQVGITREDYRTVLLN